MTHPPRPLRRETVTIASRVMLPTYAGFSAMLGLSFTLTPDERLLASPGLAYADMLVDLDAWGCGYLALSVWLVASMVLRSRDMARAGLALAVLWFGIWALVMAASAVFDQSSWSAWAWPAFIALAHWASLLSLTSQET